MKKQLLIAAAVLFSAGIISMTGCKKEDTTPPVITLVGSASIQSILNATYTDAGATAEDDEDGDITASMTVTNNVDKDLAGAYSVTYSATDAAGNTATETRTVNVYNEAAAFYEGTYTGANETDINGPYAYNPSGLKPFICTASLTVNNRVTMNRLGDFDNNAVYFTVTGTTLTIPSQTVANVGSGSNPCDVHSRTSDGSGTKTANGFNLTYNDAKVAPCTGSRTAVQAVFTK